MKYLLVLADGLPDSPYKRFDDKTPLQLARTPNLDNLAYNGRSGTVKLTASSVQAGSDSGYITITGNRFSSFNNARGFFEAKALGCEINESRTSFRVNLVSVENDELVCYGTPSFSDDEGIAIVNSLNNRFKDLPVRFFPLSGFRMVLVVDNEWLFEKKKNNLKTVRPNMNIRFCTKSNLPKGNGSKKLIELMQEARKLLSTHDINQVKIDLGENPTNGIWLWGHNYKKKLKAFEKTFGMKAHCVPGTHLIKGISMDLGMSVSDVIDPHGDAHKCLGKRVDLAKDALMDHDMVILHIESIKDISILGDIYKKCQSIEFFDEKVIGVLSEFMSEKFPDYRILVTSTHGIKLDSKLPVKNPVPWVLSGSNVKKDKCVLWSEKEAESMSFSSLSGNKLLKKTLFKQ